MKRLIAISLILPAGAFTAKVAPKPICAECGTSDNVVVAEDVSFDLGLKVYVCENCGIYYIRDPRYHSYKWYSEKDIAAVKADYARLDADRKAAREENTARLEDAGWPEDAIKRILRKQIKIGDPPEIVREAWGPPDSTYREGTAEIWVYSNFPHSSWVRFENGKVYEYQNNIIHRDQYNHGVTIGR